MLKRRFSFINLFFFMCLLTRAMEAQQEEGKNPDAVPTARPIPGITSKDVFPRGCVDCHINRPDLKMDVRLSTLMKQWNQRVDSKLLDRAKLSAPDGLKVTGKHPRVESALKNIPAECLNCHAANSRSAPPFARMLHGIHLGGGAENHFLTMFQGECTHCHKLNQTTGRWHFFSGPEIQANLKPWQNVPFPTLAEERTHFRRTAPSGVYSAE
jgi:hypothetical protein